MRVGLLSRCGLVVCLAASLLAVSSSPAGAVAGYGDVAGDRYFTEPVQWSVDNDITGIDGTCFDPDGPVSRGETAVWIWNMEGQPSGTAHPFTDITDNSQEEAIAWMAETGITTGTSDTTFSPDNTLTRGQTAAFLHRLEGEPAASKAHPFEDVTAGWQQGPVSWLAETGITTGTSATTFSPDNTLTRAQLITFLYRYEGKPAVTVDPNSPTCEPSPTTPTEIDDSTSLEPEDPAPGDLGVVQQVVVDSSGGVVEAGGTVVRVPPSATDVPLEVEIREPLGVFGAEEGVAVVGVEHQGPLTAPVSVSWDVSHLSEAQMDSILVVRWNEDLLLWLPAHVDYGIDNGVLTAQIQQWSWISVIWNRITDAAANFSQTVQEIFGRRVDAPRCAGENLPEWVTNTTAPDEGTNAAAIRLCYEHRDNKALTMRMANNRVFSQFVYSDERGAWGDEIEGPDPQFSLVGVLHQVAHKVLSDDTRVFMPPLTEAAVSIERPQGNVSHRINFHREHDLQTFVADVVFFVVSKLPTPQAAGNLAYVEVYATVLLECSLPAVTEEAAGVQGVWEIFSAAARAVTSCAAEMFVPGTDQHRKLTAGLAKRSLSKSQLKRFFGPKPVKAIRGAVRALTVGEAIAYFIDLAADEWVEYTSWHINVAGRVASLGDWEPTCSDAEEDSNRLFRNLVQRPPFTPGPGKPTLGELHTLDSWRPSAERAVVPLMDCGDSHNTYMAADVDDWGIDAADREIVSSLIRAMVSPDPTAGYTAVAAGGSHSCGLRPDRAVACWGNNTSGQLLEPDGEYDTIEAGASHNCGTRTNKTIACWGNNSNRQLNAPTGQFSTVSAGQNHSCGIRTNKTIACWGGYLTLGSVEPYTGGHANSPTGTYSAVAAGTFHTCAIRSSGTIKCWGTNSDGQLNAPDGTFSAIAAGSHFSCAVRSSETIKCWGTNSRGQLNAPDGQFSAVTAGHRHACGLRTDDTVVCWGDNTYGQSNAPDGQFSALAAGENHTCALRGGTIFCWGEDTHGQINPPAEHDVEAKKPPTPGTVSAGLHHNCAIRTDNTITCWGLDSAGQTVAPTGTFKTVSANDGHNCGLRTDNTIACWGSSNRPKATDTPSGTFRAVSAGGNHSCAIRISGTITCWGSDFIVERTNAPKGNYVAISAGTDHTCAIHTDDTIACWGNDGFGRSSPPSGTYIAISAGSNYNCAIRTNNTATCWGTPGFQKTAVPQGTYIAISAGGDHTCAIRTDNTIACWGYNNNGQTDAPQGTFTDITTSLGRSGHSCALRTDNAIICWGYNKHGQTDVPQGFGTSDPTYPTTAQPHSAVSAGWEHSCGLRQDNTITCWGNNDWGQADAPGGSFKTVTAGWAHSCGLRQDNTITCWGNGSGQADAPAGSFKTVTAGWAHSCGLRQDNTITCWGDGSGQAPAGSFKTVTAGWAYGCGLRQDNTITCWGNNGLGQADAPGGSFKTVTAGWAHSCGLRQDNTITCWGYNGWGEADAPAGSFKTVTAGWGAHSCGLRQDNTITCWGDNRSGEADAPAGSFKTVTAGLGHSCGLRQDNTITCWGYNGSGQADAPGGSFGSAAGSRRTVTVSKGALGPTSVGPGEGVPCAPATPTCRYINVDLSGFAAGTYTITCRHDGWGEFESDTFWTFSITVDNSGSASSNGPCFLNFAQLTGNGAYVTVSSPDTETVASNWLK